MARWSELPSDLLKVIEGHISMYDDKIRFRCVCTPFSQFISDNWPQTPLLLLPYKTGSMCGLYHPFENKVLDIDLPEAGEKVFRGTGHGWVVTFQQNGSIDVLNPLTRVRVPLPLRYKFPDVVEHDPDNIGEEYLFKDYSPRPPRYPYHVSSTDILDWFEKVVLSSSPLSDDFIAVALHDFDKLAYCKVGDSEWLDLVDVAARHCKYRDVTFLGGKLYTVSNRGGKLMVCDDFRCSCPRLRKCDSLPALPYRRSGEGDRLITSSSNTLVTVRRKEDPRTIESGGDSDKMLLSSTIGFHKMFRLDGDSDSTSGWTRITSLDDDEILFMGLGTQVLFSSPDFIGNRIYFVSDSLDSNCGDAEDCFDNGIFDFKEGKFKPLGYECSPRVIWPSPI